MDESWDDCCRESKSGIGGGFPNRLTRGSPAVFSITGDLGNSTSAGRLAARLGKLSFSVLPGKEAVLDMKNWQKTLALLVCAVPTLTSAQESPPTGVVRTWTEGAVIPKATINDMRWLVGQWEGKLEGATQQYVVLSPVSGHMPGFVRAWGQDGSIWFYEISDLVEVDGSLEFRDKHFSGELNGWEGKSEFVSHRLIEITDRAVYFDGLTIVKEGPEHFTVYVRIAEGERKGQVVSVHQTRVSNR